MTPQPYDAPGAGLTVSVFLSGLVGPGDERRITFAAPADLWLRPRPAGFRRRDHLSLKVTLSAVRSPVDAAVYVPFGTIRPDAPADPGPRLRYTRAEPQRDAHFELRLSRRDLCRYQSFAACIRLAAVGSTAVSRLRFARLHPGFVRSSDVLALGAVPTALRVRTLAHPDRQVDLEVVGAGASRVRVLRTGPRAWNVSCNGSGPLEDVEAYLVDRESGYREFLPLRPMERPELT
jgi:hypothetical protein